MEGNVGQERRDLVRRAEFDLLVRTQNGRLGRIETGVDELRTDMKHVVECVNGKADKDTIDSIFERLEKLAKRPSWAVLAIITLLSSAVVGLLIAIATRALT